MWHLVSRNTHLQIHLRFQTSNNFAINCTRGLYNLKYLRNAFMLPRFTDTYLKPNYFFLNITNQFSITNTLSKNKDRGKDKKKSQSTYVNLNELDEVVNAKDMLAQFDNVIDKFKDLMIKHVNLRTSIGAIEDLTVKFDAREYKLQELAEIDRKPKFVVLKVAVFPQAIPSIINMLLASQMNLNPQQDGTTIFIQIPMVTKEQREKLAKQAKVFFVKCKDNINDIRNTYIKEVKTKENLASDLVFRIEGYISTISNNYVNKAKDLLQIKQNELLGEKD